MSSLTSFKTLEHFNQNSFCVFCFTNLNDVVAYGDICEINGLATHYFCLIFSDSTQQNGLDEEGILGFLYKDILKGVRNNRKNVCFYCQHPGAAVRCAAKSCKKCFHLPCGLDNGSIHEFCDNFKSYCYQHRKSQPVPQKACKPSENVLCVICQEYVRAVPSFETIWAPCCETVWLHKRCIQEMAMNAGYFFKCPNCNNSEIFRRQVQERGVFIPDKDASWEKTENGRSAFHELTERPNSCQADECLCSEGRKYSTKQGCFKIKICHTCGSVAAHAQCVRKFVDVTGEFICESCDGITNVLPGKKNSLKPIPTLAPRKTPIVALKRLKLDTALSTRINKTDNVEVNSHSNPISQSFSIPFLKTSLRQSPPPTIIQSQSPIDFEIKTHVSSRTEVQSSVANSQNVLIKPSELEKICQPSMTSPKIIDSAANCLPGLGGISIDIVRFQRSIPLNQNVNVDKITFPTIELLSDDDDSSNESEKSDKDSSKCNYCDVISLLDSDVENNANEEETILVENRNIKDITEDGAGDLIEAISQTRFILIEPDSPS